MGTGIVEAVVQRYGRSNFLRDERPVFGFRALGSVMGMDWHLPGSRRRSRSTQRGLSDRSMNLNLSLRRPADGIEKYSARAAHAAERRGFQRRTLVRTSRITARIDNNAIADGFQIYLHSVYRDADGEWVVVHRD